MVRKSYEIRKFERQWIGFIFTNAFIIKRGSKNNNYYPSDSKLPREDTLELLKSIYAERSEEELLDMMNYIKKRKNEEMIGYSSSYDKRDNHNLAKQAWL